MPKGTKEFLFGSRYEPSSLQSAIEDGADLFKIAIGKDPLDYEGKRGFISSREQLKAFLLQSGIVAMDVVEIPFDFSKRTLRELSNRLSSFQNLLYREERTIFPEEKTVDILAA